MSKLKISLFGGGERAVELLKRIVTNWNNEIEIVYAAFMKGHEFEHQYCNELEQLAKTHNVEYIVSDKTTDEMKHRINVLKPIAIIGAGIWRSLIEEDIYSIPKYGYIGLHGTQLPKYRGWAGINWQIINGEKNIITRMYQLGNGIDNGDLVTDENQNILEFKIDIDNENHLDQVFSDYLKMHLEAYDVLFNLLIKNKIGFIKQIEEEATYACSRLAEDGEINWNESTKNVFNFIRAQSKPYNGAYTFFDGQKISMWRVKPRYDYSNYVGRIPGKVVQRDKVNDELIILTNDGGIEVIECEKENGENNKFDIFNSVRKRCKNEVEAFIENVKQRGYNLDDFKLNSSQGADKE